MLDQVQIDQFHRDGFLILRQVFGGDELDLLRLAADRVEADGISGLGRHHLYHPSPGGLKLYCRSERIWDYDPIFPAATAHPRLLEAVGQCLGQAFLPIGDAFSCSTRFGKFPIPWHQDPPYGDPRRRLTYNIPSFTAGIYLDHATVENGCLWGLPGHHLAGHLELQHHREEELYARARPLELAPGDVLLQCPSAPRASRGNPSPRTWRALHVHYLARAVLEDAYPGWQTQERGFNPQGLSLAQHMLELRQSLCLFDQESPRLTFGEAGFAFTGHPCTPPTTGKPSSPNSPSPLDTCAAAVL